MNYQAFTNAWKYAQAFLNVFYPSYGVLDTTALSSAAQFLHTHKSLWVALSYASDQTLTQHSRKLFDQFISRFNLDRDPMLVLLNYLVINRRLSLIPAVFEVVLFLEHKRSPEEDFYIELSHGLDDESKEKIVQFLSEKVQKNVNATWGQDASLLCGFRAQTREHALEVSVRRRLERLEEELVRLGGLC